MANSKYAYVRKFELPDTLLPQTYLVLRVDGQSFHRFSDAHDFAKPNDIRALQLMDQAAKDIMEIHPDVVLAFGESDEYSFLIKKSSTMFNRRQSKILSTLTSQFTSSYVFHWSNHFPDTPLRYPPSFDGRIVLYPTEKEVKDYFAWRQADTHINNLYNTTFWALVQQGGQTVKQAHETLRGTFSRDKNEILFSRFNINYNKIDARFRKGSILVREEVQDLHEENAKLPEDDQGAVAPHRETLQSSAVVEGASFNLPNDASASPSNVSSGEPKASVVIQPNELDSNTPFIPSLVDEAQAQSRIGLPIGLAQQPKQNSLSEVVVHKSKPKPRSQGKSRIELLHCDIIQEEFWVSRPNLLGA